MKNVYPKGRVFQRPSLFKNALGLIAFVLMFFITQFTQAQISYQGFKNSSTQFGASTLTIDKPNSLAINDLMIAHISQADNDDATLSNATASGWILVDGQKIREDNGSNPSSGTSEVEVWTTVLYKIATAADVAATNFSFALDSDADESLGGISHYKCVNSSNIFAAPNLTLLTSGNSNSSSILATAPGASLPAGTGIIMLAHVGNDRKLKDDSWAATNTDIGEIYDTYFTGDIDLTIGAAMGTVLTTGTIGQGSVTITNVGSPFAVDAQKNAGIFLAITPSTLPTIDTQPQGFTICEGSAGSSLNLMAMSSGPGLFYQWYSNSTNSNTGGTLISGATGSSYTPPVSSTGTTYYYCVVSSGSNAGLCGSVASQVVAVTVNPKVTPTFTAVPAICSGATLAALPTTSNNGIAGTWSPALNNTATTTYTFTPAAGACANPANLTITVKPNPTISTVAPSAATVCTGTGVSFTANGLLDGSTKFTFSVNGGADQTQTVTVSGGSHTFASATYPVGIYSIEIKKVEVDGCELSTSKTINFEVKAKVTPSFTPITACSGDAISFPAVTTNDPVTGNPVAGSWNPTTLSNMVSSNYSYVAASGACANNGSLNVTINQKATPTFTPISAICSGASLNALPTTSNNGIAGTWSPALNNTATTTYTFTPAAGACANPANLTITVKPNPTISTVAPSAATVCTGTGVSFTANGLLDGSTKFTFSVNGGADQTQTVTVVGGSHTFASAIYPVGIYSIEIKKVEVDGCELSTSKTINFEVKAKVTPSFTPITACSGDAISFPAVTTNDPVTGNPVAGSWNPTTLSNMVSSNYSYVAASGACANNGSLNVTINQKVTPTFTAVPAICSGATLAALPTTSNNGIAGTWSPALNNTATTTYTFTPAAGACANPANLTITVKPNPTISTVAPSAATVCTGTGVSFTANGLLDGSTKFTFSVNGGADQTQTVTVVGGSHTFASAIYPVGIYSIEIKKVEVDGCELSTSKTINFEVKAKVTPSFTPITACSGDAISFPAVTTNDPVTGNPVAGSWNPTTLSNMVSSNYSYVAASGACANNGSLNVTINQKVTPTFTAVPAICSGATLAALPTTSNNGIAGTWSPALNNTATTTYTFTPAAGACANPANLTITVKPNPTISTVAPSAATVCTGTGVSFTANGLLDGSTKFTFSVNGGADQTQTVTVVGGSHTFASAIYPVGIYSIEIKKVEVDGCELSTSKIFTFEVKAKVTPMFTNPGPICEGSTLSLPTSSTLDPVSGLAITGAWSPAANNMATTSYTFTSDAGQCANNASMTVVVKPLPTWQDIIFDEYCAGTNALVNITDAVPNATYQATYIIDGGSPVTVNVPFNGSGNGSFSLGTGLTVGSHNIIITDISWNGCGGDPDFDEIITIKPNPTLSGITVAPNPICTGSTSVVTFNGLINGSTTYNYTLNGNSGSGSTTVSGNMATYTVPATAPAGVYNLTINSATVNGCTTNFTVNNAASLTINANPTATITAYSTVGTPAVINPVISCTNRDIKLVATGGVSYSWTKKPAAAVISTSDNVMVSLSGIGTYAVTVTNAAGCTAATNVEVTSNITEDIGVYNLTACPSTVQVGQKSAVTFQVKNNKPASYIYPIGTVHVSYSIPVTGQYTYVAGSVMGNQAGSDDNYFTWMYDPIEDVIEGVNTKPIPAQKVENVKFEIMGTVAGTNIIGTLNTQVGDFVNTPATLAPDNCFVENDILTLGVTVIPAVTSVATITNETCIYSNDGKADLSAIGTELGVTPLTYTIAGTGANTSGASTGMFTGLIAGNYTFSITNSASCVLHTGSFTISEPSAVTTTASVTNVKCNGGNSTIVITGTGGNGGAYTFGNAMPGAISPTATSSPSATYTVTAGTYSIVIQDVKGCTGEAINVIVTQPNALLIEEDYDNPHKNVTCKNGKDGAFGVIASGGTSPYGYNVISPSVITGAAGAYGNYTYSLLAAGTYVVAVTDANGCTASTSVEITEPTAVTAQATVTNALCFGDKGTVVVNAGGGNGGPYTFNTPSGLTVVATTSPSVTFSGLAGMYTVVATDSKGCTGEVKIEIKEPSKLEIAETASAHMDVKCKGGSDGSVTVVASGGTSPYTYTFGTNTNTYASGVFNGLMAGNYTINVEDVNGCKTSVNVSVTEPTALVINTGSIVNNTCVGGTSGSFTATASGGTPGYSYAIISPLTSVGNMSGATSGIFTGLAVGTYTVEVTDANGCKKSTTAEIKDPVSNGPDMGAQIPRPLNATFTVNPLTKEGYVQVTNITNTPSTGSVTFRISVPANFTIDCQQGTLTVPSSGNFAGLPVASFGNATVTSITPVTVGSGVAYYEVVTNGPIPCFSNVKIGFKITSAGSASTSGIMSCSVLAGSGGDINVFNNVSVKIFSIN